MRKVFRVKWMLKLGLLNQFTAEAYFKRWFREVWINQVGLLSLAEKAWGRFMLQIKNSELVICVSSIVNRGFSIVKFTSTNYLKQGLVI